MFDYNRHSIFDEEDEFGVQEYRMDSNYLFDLNRTVVKIIRWNDRKSKTLQGDFLGTTLATEATERDEEEFISINIMSTEPEKRDLEQEGFTNLGVVSYTCFANYDVDIENRDIIEFVSKYGTEIKEGERFRVVMDDAGLYQGQYTRKQFTIYKIADNPINER
jgi:hypothetical protein